MGKTVFIQDFFMVLVLGKSLDIPIINATAQI